MTENVPVYRWDSWPEGLFTEKQLRAKGLLPGQVAGLIPYSKSKDGDGYLRVYRLDEATPKPPLSEAQQAAVDKMQAGKLAKRTCRHCGTVHASALHRGICPRCDVVRWAQQLLETDVVILDTETTGVDRSAEILAVSVIDKVGNVLLDTYVKPDDAIIEIAEEEYDEDNWKHRRYGPGLTAFGVNGITNAMVAGAPMWPEVAEELRPILDGKIVVCYNEAFDHRMLDDDCEFHHMRALEAAAWDCLMLAFAQWYGEWNYDHNDYRWQSLSTAAAALSVERGAEAHTAAGDCFTSLGVLKALAAQAKAWVDG